MSLTAAQARNGLVIGIDFGTTYSGVAWATAADFERQRINSVLSWPGTGRTECKVPTELCYGNGQDKLWGYQIPSHEPRLQLFKLLLLDPQDLSSEMQSSPLVQRARDVLRNSGKSAVQVIADYLQLLWNHTQEILNKALGRAVVAGLPFHFVMTIPAIWKPYARQRMQEAVTKAGLMSRRLAGQTYLSFAPEPEAAALATLLERQWSITQGSTHVVCDAGGGTVDLITYAIESVNPIRMAEAVEGTGGLCGGVFIDEAFERICKRRLDPHWKGLSRAAKTDFMKGPWENSIKHHFKPGNAQAEYPLSLPNEMLFSAKGKGKQKRLLNDTTKEPHIVDGHIHFKETHIREAFENVLFDIWKLVEAQVQKAAAAGTPVTGVILVGGLGSSPYLYDHLSAKLARSNIAIIQPHGTTPRSAIAHGAVCKGFLDAVDNGTQEYHVNKPIEITATIARVSVGVRTDEKWDEEIHQKVDKYWCDNEGVWSAGNQMVWHLKKGERVETKGRISHPFYSLEETNWDGRWAVNLYQCEDEEPPSRFTESVEYLCTLDCTLENCMPVSRIRNHTTPKGKKMKRLSYNIRMIPTGSSVTFDVEVNHTRLGMKNLDIKSLTGNSLDISSSFQRLAV